MGTPTEPSMADAKNVRFTDTSATARHVCELQDNELDAVGGGTAIEYYFLALIPILIGK